MQIFKILQNSPNIGFAKLYLFVPQKCRKRFTRIFYSLKSGSHKLVENSFVRQPVHFSRIFILIKCQGYLTIFTGHISVFVKILERIASNVINSQKMFSYSNKMFVILNSFWPFKVSYSSNMDQINPLKKRRVIQS